MLLFAGLGNPGAKYAGYRHNVGFMAADAIHRRHSLSPWSKKFQALFAEGRIGGEKVMLIKPQTFMNLSGQSVGDALRFFKLDAPALTVFYDELDLAPGKVRVKTGGGAGGHNGIRSIEGHVGSGYRRVRIGIGHPGVKELVQGWVLHDFSRDDQAWLVPLLDAVADAAPRLATGDSARFLTDVARMLDDGAGDAKPPRRDTGATTEPAADRDRPAKGSARHPAGEGAGKRATALADNLRNWLASRRQKD
jgi:PTH1 family peptidyl-tRNA hydrolase